MLFVTSKRVREMGLNCGYEEDSWCYGYDFMTFSFPLAISDGPSCYFSSKLANEQVNIST